MPPSVRRILETTALCGAMALPSLASAHGLSRDASARTFQTPDGRTLTFLRSGRAARTSDGRKVHYARVGAIGRLRVRAGWLAARVGTGRLVRGLGRLVDSDGLETMGARIAGPGWQMVTKRAGRDSARSAVFRVSPFNVTPVSASEGFPMVPPVREFNTSDGPKRLLAFRLLKLHHQDGTQVLTTDHEFYEYSRALQQRHLWFRQTWTKFNREGQFKAAGGASNLKDPPPWKRR